MQSLTTPLSHMLERLLDLSQDPIALFEKDGTLIHLSHSWTELTGYDIDDCLGRPLTDFLWGASADVFFRQWSALAETSQASAVMDLVVHDSDRRPLTVRLNTTTWPNVPKIHGGGIFFRIPSSAPDPHQLSAEEEGMSYLPIFHDLRSPLRAMDGFAKILQENYVDCLDEEGRKCIDRVRSATSRMNTMIEGLMSLTQVTQLPLSHQQLDLSAIANNIIHTMAFPTHITWRITQPLMASASHGLVEIILQNLLDNAIKFTANEPHPMIEFSQVSAHPSIYVVRDNGSGFDSTRYNEFFQPFFHRQGHPINTGIGLSLVMMAVRRLGGLLWAESRPNQGASFYFTLGNDNP